MEEEQFDPDFDEFVQPGELDPDAASVLPPADAEPEKSLTEQANERRERQWQLGTLPIILVVGVFCWIVLRGCHVQNTLL